MHRAIKKTAIKTEGRRAERGGIMKESLVYLTAVLERFV